jgi:hypothetical protein
MVEGKKSLLVAADYWCRANAGVLDERAPQLLLQALRLGSILGLAAALLGASLVLPAPLTFRFIPHDAADWGLGRAVVLLGMSVGGRGKPPQVLCLHYDVSGGLM